MPHKVNAIVTRPRGINGQYAYEQVILDMPANKFDDWRDMGWVARATAEQVAAEREALEKVAADRAASEAAERAVDIASAIGLLDKDNDAHWTKEGLPTVDAVSELVDQPVTRAEIETAAPDAVRPA